MSTLAKIGLCELAVGALLGWAVVVRVEQPALLERIGIRSPRRLLQVHLDYILMGLILIAVGGVLPDLADPWKAALIFGTIVNPSLFVPLAFAESWSKRLPYRALTIVSFLAMSSGLVAAAVTGLGR
jgi:hypothetical protein